MNHIILASQSPRRAQLLATLGVSFDTIPSAFVEVLDESKLPAEVAKELALGKANAVAELYPDAYVIGSDTVVALGNRQMEKPVDIDDAREMLTTLAGTESIVVTGIVVVCKSKSIEVIDSATTKVFFKPDSSDVAKLREEYLASGDWKDKAAGYGIQSGAGTLIERIEGDYDTVVGLPTSKLREILKRLELL